MSSKLVIVTPKDEMTIIGDYVQTIVRQASLCASKKQFGHKNLAQYKGVQSQSY